MMLKNYNLNLECNHVIHQIIIAQWSSLVFPVRVDGLLPFCIHENVRVHQNVTSPPTPLLPPV